MKIQMILLYATDWAFHEGNQDRNKEFKPMKAWAGGILVKESKDNFAFAMEDFEDGDFREVLTIPKNCVEKYKIFTIEMED